MSGPQFLPDEICGYRVVKALGARGAILADTSNGRRVVLKPLDNDCLLRGQLHPSIKERLARVRELAHPQVANLQSVEREGTSAWLVWDYVEGQTFEAFASEGKSPRQLMLAAREIVLMVESLHLQGIVHGALHGRNVLLHPDGRWRLTQVSPLLFSDPQQDARDVVFMLRDCVESSASGQGQLGEFMKSALEQLMPLRTMRSRLAAMVESREMAEPVAVRLEEKVQDQRIRRKAVYAAAAVTGVGVIVAGGVWLAAHAGSDRPPPPPQASRAALDAPTSTVVTPSEP